MAQNAGEGLKNGKIPLRPYVFHEVVKVLIHSIINKSRVHVIISRVTHQTKYERKHNNTELGWGARKKEREKNSCDK